MPLSTPPSAQAATALKSLRHKFFDREPCWHPLREGPAFRSLASAPASPTLKRSLTSFGLPARSLPLSSFCLPVSSFQSSPRSSPSRACRRAKVCCSMLPLFPHVSSRTAAGGICFSLPLVRTSFAHVEKKARPPLGNLARSLLLSSFCLLVSSFQLS